MTLGPQLDSPQGRPEIVNIGDLPKIEKRLPLISHQTAGLATNDKGFIASVVFDGVHVLRDTPASVFVPLNF